MEETNHIEEWLQYLKIYKDASKYTLKNYPIHINSFLKFTEGNINVTPKTINSWVYYLLEEKEEARTTVNARISAIKSFYNYLYNEEIINKKIADKIEFIKLPPNKPKKLMKQEDIIKILDSITFVRDRAILETLYSTGIREGECSALNIKDVDFENKLLIVLKAKGNKTRVVPISNTALKWIKASLGSRKEGPLFLNNRATRLSERSIYNIVTKYFPFSPHELRHCFATHLITKTGNIKAVSEMLGHASILLTEKIYTHMSSEHLKDVYKKSGMDRD